MTQKSSDFTKATAGFGPPLIGALLRMPWERCGGGCWSSARARIDDLDTPHLNVLLSPGPKEATPGSPRAEACQQAVNYLLAGLNVSVASGAGEIRATDAPSASPSLVAAGSWTRRPCPVRRSSATRGG